MAPHMETELRNKALCKVLQAIDSKPVELDTKKDQVAWCENFLKDHRLHKWDRGSKQKVPLDADVLRGMLQTTVTNYRKPVQSKTKGQKAQQTGIADLFKKGSKILSDASLSTMGYEVDSESEHGDGDPESDTAKPGPSKPRAAKRAREDSDDEENDEHEAHEDAPRKKPKQSAQAKGVLKLKVSPRGRGRSAGRVTTDPPGPSSRVDADADEEHDTQSAQHVERRTVHSEASSPPKSSVSVGAENNQGAAPQKPSSKVLEPGVSDGAAGATGSHMEGGGSYGASNFAEPQFSDKSEPAAASNPRKRGWHIDIDALELSSTKRQKTNLESDDLIWPTIIGRAGEARRPSIDEHNDGCDKKPMYNAQEHHAAQIIKDGWIFPPELRPRGKCAHQASESRRMPHAVIDGKMARMYRDIMYKMLDWFYAHGIDPDAEAEFVQSPQPELEKLYTHFFGTANWKTRVLDLQHGKSPRRLFALQMIMGIVGSSIYQSVLEPVDDWDLESKFDKALGMHIRHFRQALDDKGHYLEEVLKQVRFKMMNDPEFEANVIAPKSKEAASTLIMALTHHLRLAKATRQPDNAVEPEAAETETRLIKTVYEVFHSAFMLKGKMRAAWDATYDFIWLQAGTKYVPGSVRRNMPEWQPEDEMLEIVLCMWPAILAKINQLGPDGDDSIEDDWIAEAECVMHRREEPWP